MASKDAVAQSEWANKNMVWVPIEDGGFAAASIVEEGKDKTTVMLDGGKQITVNSDEIQKMNPPKFDKVPDMAELTCLNEASVLHNLSQRYFSDQIYTYSGLFCVVLNPYKRLKIYNDEYVLAYKNKKRHEMDPHVFAIADEAYRSMLQDRENQSILCTGESGAGKTENTKKVIQYLVGVASRSADDKSATKSETSLESQLLQTNPLMEAFGNAKTVKNDNSSRFGKFIRINFDHQGCISGTAIETYILESGRVPRHNEKERTFHIFYQLLKGCNAAMKEQFLLMSPSEYRFLMNRDSCISGVDDGEEFKETVKAMTIIGFNKDDVDAVLRLVSAVLMFGNLKFVKGSSGDQCKMGDTVVEQKLCKLLAVNTTEFSKALLTPRIKAGRDFVTKSQSIEQAEFSSEALAKALYDRLFKYIIAKINKSLDRDKKVSSSFVGILDVAGFEIFEVNSYEQMCINYTNEKLQQLFNHTMFVKEQEEYTNEGIEWDFIDFGLDLQPCIELLESKDGIFAMLDEECVMPKGSDANLVMKMIQTLTSHPKFEKTNVKSSAHIIIHHYAGKVEYTITGWIAKNNDALNENVTQIFAKSSCTYMQNLWMDFGNLGADQVVASRARKGMFRTISQIYKEQLRNLMTTLHDTQPNFVRCIIPNLEKKPGKVLSKMILEQLRCNGVLEGIRICRQGFPNRIVFNEFKTRYELLTPNVVPSGFMDGKKAVELMLQKMELAPANYRIGHSKIFFRAGILATLEEDRDKILTEYVVQFQALIRGKIARRYFFNRNNMKASVDVIQRNLRLFFGLRKWSWWRLFTKIKPLVEITRQDNVLKEKEDALKKATERLNRLEVDMKETEQRAQTLTDERKNLLDQIQIAQEGLNSLEEKNSMLTNRATQLDSIVTDLEAQLLDEEEKSKKQKQELDKINSEMNEIKESLASAQFANQKLTTDNQSMDAKIKQLEQEIASLTEQVSRLTKEKKSLEDKLAEAQSKLQIEEDRAKNLNKAKGKQEGAITELSDKISSLEKSKAELEREIKSSDNNLNLAKNQINELNTKCDLLAALSSKREQEISQMNLRLEEESAKKASLDRELRDLKIANEELQEEHEAEKSARSRAERQANEFSSELDNLRNQLDASMDTSAAQKDYQAKRDQELSKLKATMQEEIERHESMISEMKNRQNQVVQELNDQLDQLKKSKASADRAKSQIETKKSELEDQMTALTNAKNEYEKKIRQYESSQGDAKSQIDSLVEERDKLISDLSRVKRECDNLNITVDDLEKKVSQLESECSRASSSLEEAQEQLQSEISAKASIQSKLNILNSSLQSTQEQSEEQEERCSNLSRQLNEALKNYQNAQLELEQVKANMEENDNAKRKLVRDLEDAQQKVAQLSSECSKFEKMRKKFRQDMDDTNLSLEQSKQAVIALEKKQKKFDQMLSEEKANSERACHERDAAEAAARSAETKVMQLNQKYEDAQSQLMDLERAKRNLQQELDHLSQGKDDAGKTLFDTEKECSRLRNLCQELQEQLDDQATEFSMAEDEWNRTKVQLDAASQNLQREMEAREQAMSDEKRMLQRQLNDMRSSEEEIRKNRGNIESARKKVEAELRDLQSQLEEATRARDESIKNQKKTASMVKELQLEMEKLKSSREESINLAKDNAKKLRTAEMELENIKYTIDTLTRQKNALQLEKDQLAEELESKALACVTMDEKKRLDSKIQQLQEDYDDVSDEIRSLKNRLKTATDHADQSSSQLREARDTVDTLQLSNMTLSNQLKETQEQLGELERMLKTKSSAFSEAERRATRAQDELSSQTNELNSLKKNNKSLQRNVTSVTDEMEHYKMEVDKLKKYIEVLNGKHNTMSKLCQSQDSEMQRLRQELNSLRSSQFESSQMSDVDFGGYGSNVNFQRSTKPNDDDDS